MARRRLVVGALLVCLLSTFPFGSAGATGGGKEAEFSEYEIKASFLLNFARFVEWPDAAAAKSKDPIVIVIMGQDPFGPKIEQMFAGETVSGRKVEVRRIASDQELGVCHLLFIPRTGSIRDASLQTRLKDRPVLTVGESDGFAREGGIIQLALDKGRIVFDINRAAAEKAGLKISPRLLKVARSTDVSTH